MTVWRENHHLWKMWYVVIFIEEDVVAVVPTRWYVDQSKKCFWPPKSSKKSVLTLAREKHSPDDDWSSYRVRILGKYDNFQKATEKLKKATEKDNLSSTDQDQNGREKRKRKRKPNVKYTQEDEGSETEETSTDSVQYPSPPATGANHCSQRGSQDVLSYDTRNKSVRYENEELAHSMSQKRYDNEVLTPTFRNRYENEELEPSISQKRYENEVLTPTCRNRYENEEVEPSISQKRYENEVLTPTCRNRYENEEVEPSISQKRYENEVLTPTFRNRYENEKLEPSISQKRYENKVLTPSTPRSRYENEELAHSTSQKRYENEVLIPFTRPASRNMSPVNQRASVNNTQDNSGANNNNLMIMLREMNSDNIEFKRQVLRKLHMINLKLNDLEIAIQQVKHSDSEIGEEHEILEIMEILPINNDDGLQQMETFLSDGNNKKLMIRELGRVGGADVPEIVKRLMYKLFGNELGMKYSWDGAKKKNKFKNLKISDVIFDAVRQNKKNATEADIILHIKKWFVRCKDRLENHRKRTANRTVPEEEVEEERPQ